MIPNASKKTCQIDKDSIRERWRLQATSCPSKHQMIQMMYAEERIPAGFGWQSPGKGQHAQNGAQNAAAHFFCDSCPSFKLGSPPFLHVALETLVIY